MNRIHGLAKLICAAALCAPALAMADSLSIGVDIGGSSVYHDDYDRYYYPDSYVVYDYSPRPYYRPHVVYENYWGGSRYYGHRGYWHGYRDGWRDEDRHEGREHGQHHRGQHGQHGQHGDGD